MIEVKVSVKESGSLSNTNYSIEGDLDGTLTLSQLLQFTKNTLILLSSQVLNEELALGFDKDYRTFVDGNERKPIANVHPLGRIEFAAKRNIEEVILAAYEGILSRSPVDTGAYKKANVVLLNSTIIATDMAGLKSWFAGKPEIKDNDFFFFVNSQPYARKLERYGIRAGTEGGTIGRQRRTASRDKRKAAQGQTVLLPNGGYFLTAKSIKARFKNNVGVKFTFISGANLGLAGSFRTGRRGKNSSGRPYLYPAKIIGVSGKGVNV